MSHRTVKKFMYYNESAHEISYANMFMSSLQYIIFHPQHAGQVLNFSLVCRSSPVPSSLSYIPLCYLSAVST